MCSAKTPKGPSYKRFVLDMISGSGFVDDAQRLAERWVASRPDMPEAHSALGLIYYDRATETPPTKRDLLEKAKECFKKTLELDSQDSDALFMLSLIAELTGNMEEHEEYHRMVMELSAQQTG